MKKGSNLKIAIVCIVLIAIIVALSASPIGWKIEEKSVDSVNLKDIVVIRKEGEPDYGLSGISVYTVTVTNTFIPRQYELPNVFACLYNSDLRTTSYATTQWDVQQQATEFGSYANTLEVISGTKTATLKIIPGVRYKPSPERAVPVKEQAMNETYDQLLLFFQDPGERYVYVDCLNLQPSDFDKAVKIQVLK